MPKKRTRPLPFDAKEVGKRLSLARARCKLSTHQLSAISGVDQGKISLTERGKAVHNLADLVEICRATRHRLEWIMFDREPAREGDLNDDDEPSSSTAPMDFVLDDSNEIGKPKTKVTKASAGASKIGHGRRN